MSTLHANMVGMVSSNSQDALDLKHISLFASTNIQFVCKFNIIYGVQCKLTCGNSNDNNQVLLLPCFVVVSSSLYIPFFRFMVMPHNYNMMKGSLEENVVMLKFSTILEVGQSNCIVAYA